MSKHPKEAMDFLNYVAETSKAWDEPNPREAERMRPAAKLRGAMYSIIEDMEMKAKLSTLTRRLKELEMRNHHQVRAVIEASMPNNPCFTCQSNEHQGEHFPTAPSGRDMMAEHANVVGQYNPSTNAPYGNTYTPTRGTTLTSPRSQSLNHMYPLLRSNSMAPHLNHCHLHLHLQLNKL